MRVIWCVLFIAFVVVIGIFAFENNESVPITYLDRSLSAKSIHLPMSLLIGGVYGIGMLTGWAVVGFLKRTVQHVTEHRRS